MDQNANFTGGESKGTRNILCVVTGIEHSGTTLLSQLFNGHPEIASGVECGILLSDIHDFNQVVPFYDWLAVDIISEKNWGWGISTADRDYLLMSKTFEEFYQRLNERKGLVRTPGPLKDKFLEATLIIDKTPRYIYELDKVMRKINRPFIVTFKTFSEQFLSLRKRIGPVGIPNDPEKLRLIDSYAKRYLFVIHKLKSCLEEHGNSRLLIVPYKQLVLDCRTVMKKLKTDLGLHDSYVLDLERYNETFGQYIVSQNSFDSSALKYEDPLDVLAPNEIALCQAYSSVMPKLDFIHNMEEMQM